MSNIPQTLINCMAYSDGNRLVGITTLELPKFDSMTSEVKGAGIAGTADIPVLGHFESMEAVANYRVITDSSIAVVRQASTKLEFRASLQIEDMKTRIVRTQPVKVVMVCRPKSVESGSMEPGSAMDTKVTYEVTYIKVTIDNEERAEFDKFNMIYKVDGVDLLASVRRDLGM